MYIQRIVKMTFHKNHCEDFETYFNEIKNQVGNQPGCHGVKLLKEENETGVYFTYSVWDSQEHLDAYRFTPLFKMVWPKVKEWFADKPEAWSTTVILESV
jgi:hypothetical protein